MDDKASDRIIPSALERTVVCLTYTQYAIKAMSSCCSVMYCILGCVLSLSTICG